MTRSFQFPRFTVTGSFFLSFVLAILSSGPAGAISDDEDRLLRLDEGEELVQALREMQLRSVFRDCKECPEMVVVPAGRFRMGDVSGGGESDERPVHEVTIAYPFAAGRYEVTFAEWDACAADGGCTHRPGDQRWGRENRPVINVSWDDAQAYVRWLSRETGKPYRLLSEAEWEYVARAGTTTKYPWGDDIGTNKANCGGCGSRSGGHQKTASVGSFDPNAFGLFDTVGNVWEWVEDCWHDSYSGAPADGSAWTSGGCGIRVVRGGAWSSFDPPYLRSANRYRYGAGVRQYKSGFRIARTLTP